MFVGALAKKPGPAMRFSVPSLIVHPRKKPYAGRDEGAVPGLNEAATMPHWPDPHVELGAAPADTALYCKAQYVMASPVIAYCVSV